MVQTLGAREYFRGAIRKVTLNCFEPLAQVSDCLLCDNQRDPMKSGYASCERTRDRHNKFLRNAPQWIQMATPRFDVRSPH